MSDILVHAFDDEPVILEWMQEMFPPELFKLRVFEDPNEFRTAFTKDVDLIITDLRAPGYDWDETLTYFKSIRPNGLFIIVISAHFTDDIFERLFELGVDRTVRKGSDMKWMNKIPKYVNDLFPRIFGRTKILQ